MKYRVVHRTEYTYNADVVDSWGVCHVTPRDLPWQTIHDHRTEITPAPLTATSRTDAWGNSRLVFQVLDPHAALTVEATTDVDVSDPAYDPIALAAPWELSRPRGRPDATGAWEATGFAIESALAAHAPGVFEYAAESLTPGRPLAEAVEDLTHRIWRDFAYDATATTVTSTVADVLAQRAGVCQDFAHLALACLRSHGVAARYVSGYLATTPPPGKERVVGADASHAWLAVWVGGSNEWLATDPTNDQLAGDRYVTVSWGRDYRDVAPVRGVIITTASDSALHVSVDVAPTGS